MIKTGGRHFCAGDRTYKPHDAPSSQVVTLVVSILLCVTSSACVVIKAPVDPPAIDQLQDQAGAKELRKFADEGDVSAQYELGLLYKLGKGVPKSYGQAKRWLEEAAKRGHAEAQVDLGTLYLRGEGAPYSGQMALFWFSRSAEQGNLTAFTNLGEMYAQARGVSQDLIQAYMWFMLAGAKGDESSAARRDDVGRKMTADQIAEAEDRAQVWRPTAKSIESKLVHSSILP